MCYWLYGISNSETFFSLYRKGRALFFYSVERSDAIQMCWLPAAARRSHSNFDSREMGYIKCVYERLVTSTSAGRFN